jgi:FHA domain
MNTDILVQNILWILPITLAILALIQFLYWLFLNNSVPSEKKSKVSAVTSPVMPTYPDNLVDRPLGGTGGGVTREPQPETTALGEVVPKMIMLNHPKGRKEIKLPNTPSYGMGRFYNREYNILIALDERSISRRHAVLSRDTSSNQYFLTDTNSSYGTAIQRGETFTPMTPGEEERIYHNDIVQFGRSLTVQFTLPGPTRQSVTGGM